MKIQWRKNPKTEEGWLKRTAISLLVGVAGFAVGFPAAFFLMLEYLRRTRPGDTENFLAAMTAAVVAGLGVAAVGFFGAMLLLWMWSVRGGKDENAGVSPLRDGR
jgi:preprotein translocase subunit Sss1